MNPTNPTNPLPRSQLYLYIGIGILALVLGLIIFGPGRQLSPPPPASISFWGVRDDENVWREIIEKFQASYPHLKVSYERLEEASYEEILLNRLAEGRGPDVFMLKNSWLEKHKDKIVALEDARRFPREPHPVPGLTPRVISQAFADEIFSNLVTRENKIMGMPLYLDTLVLFYNKDIFNAAGIAVPPKTWEETESISRNLTRTSRAGDIIRTGLALGGSRGIDYAFEILSSLALQKGAEIIKPGSRELSLGLPAEEALKFYASFADARSLNYSWRDGIRSSLEALAEGDATMILGFSQDAERIKKRNPQLNLGIAPFPQFKEVKSAAVYPEYWFLAVSRLSKNPGPAWQFAAFAASLESAKIYNKNTLRPPARRDLLTQEPPSIELNVPYRQVLIARGWPAPDEKAAKHIFEEAIESVSRRVHRPDEAIRRMEQKLQALLP